MRADAAIKAAVYMLVGPLVGVLAYHLLAEAAWALWGEKMTFAAWAPEGISATVFGVLCAAATLWCCFRVRAHIVAIVTATAPEPSFVERWVETARGVFKR